MVVLDEAQAIKNPGAKQTRAVKALRARIRLALTGTPVENRLGRSLVAVRFTCPGLLGSAKAFGRFVRPPRSALTAATARCASWSGPTFFGG